MQMPPIIKTINHMHNITQIIQYRVLIRYVADVRLYLFKQTVATKKRTHHNVICYPNFAKFQGKHNRSFTRIFPRLHTYFLHCCKPSQG